MVIPKGFLKENAKNHWGYSLGFLLMYVRDNGMKWRPGYSEYIDKKDYIKFFEDNIF